MRRHSKKLQMQVELCEIPLVEDAACGAGARRICKLDDTYISRRYCGVEESSQGSIPIWGHCYFELL